MNIVIKTLSFIGLWCALSGLAAAQDTAAPAPAPAAVPAVPVERAAHAPSPAKTDAQAEAGEPRADTSAPNAVSVPSLGPAAGVDAVAGVDAAAGASPAPRIKPAGPSLKPASSAAASGAQREARHAETGSGKKSAGAVDKLTLGTATVTGDREQPKVMYIVPWKKSDIGDLAAKPMNSLVDEILAPVDRDEFKREVSYYQAEQADATQNGASPGPQQVEK